MRTFSTVMVLALVPSSLAATPITAEEPGFASVTFEQYLEMGFFIEFPAMRAEDIPGWPATTIVGRSFPFVYVEWDIPPFDPTLGRVEGLVMDWNYTETVTTDPPGLGALFLLVDNIGQTRGLGGHVSTVYTPDSPPIGTWRIDLHPDSRTFYSGTIAATFDVRISGQATATYYYTPAAAVPEPASLLLLGGGLIGAAWKRRRQHR